MKVRLLCTVLPCLLVACGASTIDHPGADVDAPIGGPGIADAPTGPDARVLCGGAVECDQGSVCDPQTGHCVAMLGCSTHSDCGKQAFCDNGVCAVNRLGGLCDNDEQCLSVQTCTSHHCG